MGHNNALYDKTLGKRIVKLQERKQDEWQREGGVDSWTRTSHLLAPPLVHPWILPLCLQSLVPSLLWSFVAWHPLIRLPKKFTQLFEPLNQERKCKPTKVEEK